MKISSNLIIISLSSKMTGLKWMGLEFNINFVKKNLPEMVQ